MVVFRDRVAEAVRGVARGDGIIGIIVLAAWAAGAGAGGEGAFAHLPTVVGAPGAEIDLLDLVLADVVDEHPALPAVLPAELLRVAQTIGPHERRRRRHGEERVVDRDAPLGAVGARERVDAQDLAQRRGDGLAVVARIVAVTAVAEADVKVAVVGGAEKGVRVEADDSAVVVRCEFADAEDLTRRAGEAGRERVARGPLAYHLVMIGVVVGEEVRNPAGTIGAVGGIELAVAGPGRIAGEVRVERHADQPFLARRRYDGKTLGAQVQIRRHAGAVRADAVDDADSVGHEQVGGVVRCLCQKLDACRTSVSVFRKRCKILKLDQCPRGRGLGKQRFWKGRGCRESGMTEEQGNESCRCHRGISG